MKIETNFNLGLRNQCEFDCGKFYWLGFMEIYYQRYQNLAPLHAIISLFYLDSDFLLFSHVML